MHPLGKSPVIEDHGMKLCGIGRHLEYLRDTYDGIGRLNLRMRRGNNTIDSGYIALKVRSCLAIDEIALYLSG